MNILEMKRTGYTHLEIGKEVVKNKKLWDEWEMEYGKISTTDIIIYEKIFDSIYMIKNQQLDYSGIKKLFYFISKNDTRHKFSLEFLKDYYINGDQGFSALCFESISTIGGDSALHFIKEEIENWDIEKIETALLAFKWVNMFGEMSYKKLDFLLKIACDNAEQRPQVSSEILKIFMYRWRKNNYKIIKEMSETKEKSNEKDMIKYFAKIVTNHLETIM